MIFAPDGKTLTAVGYHDGIKRWDAATGENTGTWKAAGYVPVAAFSPDGKTLATVSVDKEKEKTIEIWDVGMDK
jgi:WD40 repeat protein